MSEDKLSDEALQDAFQQRSASASSDIDPETVWEAVHGRLSQEERQQIVARMVTEPDVAEMWRLAEAAQRASEDEEEAESASSAASKVISLMAWKRRVVPMGLAAVAVAATLALVWQREPPPKPQYRQMNEASLQAVGAKVLSKEAALLKWSMPNAPADARYALLVVDDRLNELVTVSRLEQPQYLIPASALTSVASGEKIHWTVSLRKAGGLNQSATFTSTIK